MRGHPARQLEDQPLVAVVCGVPLLYEALRDVLAEIAQVRRFPARPGDMAGLLRWLEPDAVVVDSEEDAADAAVFARRAGTPLVHVSFRDGGVRVLGDEGWEESENALASAEEIRNILVGGLFGRRGGS